MFPYKIKTRSISHPYICIINKQNNTTMKTKSISIALLMVFFATVFATGKGDPGSLGLAVVAVKGTEVFRVIYKGESASRVKLNVYNADSEIVFSETMNHVDGFIRPLNFNGLKFGEYTIELVDAAGKKSERVNYQPLKSESTIHVSKLDSDAGKFLLSVERNNSKVISVKIFDSANNLLHSTTKEVTADYAQLYSLKNISGAVTFVVSDNAGVTKTIQF